MLTLERVTRLLKLHERAYGLFTWLNASMKGGGTPLVRVGDSLAFADAAVEFLKVNHGRLPEEHRPEAADLEETAHLFVSYLATSYEVVDHALVRTCPGCWCCYFWAKNRHLQARNPDKKAASTARKLKLLYLRNLADEAELPLTDAELDAFYGKRRELWPEIALATYVRELDRRSHFASQGEAVLSLWRELAWEDGKPRKKFRLKADAAVAAEAKIRKAIEEHAGTL